MGQPKPQATSPAPKDRIDLRLFNTILIYDVYTVARTAEAARESLLSAIRAGESPVEPTESVAREVTMRNSIRQSWTEQKPYYASDVTDEEFDGLKEHDTLQMWARLYTRDK